MKNTCRLFFACSFLACGTTSIQGSGGGGGSSSATTGSSTEGGTSGTGVATAVHWTGATEVVLREGIWEKVAGSWVGAIGNLETHEELPAGVSVKRSDDGAILLRANYGSTSGEARFSAKDDLGEAESSWSLVVKPLAWVNTASWVVPDGPVAREHGSLFFGSAGQIHLMGGGAYPNYPNVPVLGDSWTFDLNAKAWSTWVPEGELPAAAGARRVAVSADGRKVFYGGYPGGNPSGTTTLDELYVLQGNTFQKITQTDPAPIGGELGALVYDKKHDRFAYFGGIYADTQTQDVLRETWTLKLNGGAAEWTKWTVSGARPTARYGTFFGMDDATHRMIMWSGAQRPVSAENPINPAQDLWALDLSQDTPAWSKLEATGDLPTGRRNGCGVFDPVGRRLFVWGGTADGMTNVKDSVHILDLETLVWTVVTREGEPHVRSSGFGLSLGDGGVIMGFGNDQQVYRDLSVLGYK